MKRLLLITGLICITAGLLFAPTGPTAVGPAAKLNDTLFRIYDGGDATKLLAFEVSGISTSTTRTVTWPDRNLSFPLIHELGGLEVDVSAYNGLVKISGGSTSTVTDNSTNWDTAYTHSQDNTQAHTDYMLNTGDTATGDYTFSTNLLHIDQVPGRVGIGRTAPQNKLHVVGIQGEKYAVACIEAASTPSTYHCYLTFVQPTSGKNVGSLLYLGSTLKWYGPDYVTGAGGYLRYYKSTAPASNMLLLYDDGTVKLPTVYSNDIGTERDLLIKSDGELGYDSSSIEYKENIRDINDSEKIYQLRPVRYDRKDGTAKDQIGLIAEEVEQVYPEFVSYKREPIIGIDETLAEPKEGIIGYELTNIPETVNYRKLVVPLIKEVQRLRTELDTLKAEVEALK